MRTFRIALLFILTFAGGALVAAYLIGQTDRTREESTLWITLSNNSSLLRGCVERCSDGQQLLLIAENDIALFELQTLESGDRFNPLTRAGGYLITAVLIEAIRDQHAQPSSVQIVELYGKMGCGLSGVICH